MMRLFSFDPGETVGWCRFANNEPFSWGQFDWTDKAKLLSLFQNTDTPPTHVVAERYSLYRSQAAAQVNSEFPPVQIIGMLRLLAWQCGSSFDTQPASMVHDGGHIIPPLRKYVDPYIATTTKNRHARDAMAHGFAWLKKNAYLT